MVDKNIFDADRETAWCPGCGNFPLRKSLAEALAGLDITPDRIAMFTGIGQAAKMPHYIRVNGFNGLHGRALPPALGFRMVNPELKVIVESGDGDTYGEGGNHILHNIRRNPDIAHFVHDNKIYGLTKGQASPTTGVEIKTEVQPYGITADPFNPIKFAVAMGASFVARAFVGNQDHLIEMMQAAIEHEGYALVDILQPCVTFNKVNTYQWYSKRSYVLDDDYDPTDYRAALDKSEEWGNEIPLGVIYKNDNKKPFRSKFNWLSDSFVKDYKEPAEYKDLMHEFA